MIDGHADTAQRFLDDRWDFSDPLGHGMLNLDSARKGGLASEFFAIWVDPSEYEGRFAPRTLQLIDAVHEQVRRHPRQLSFCRTADEIEQACASGRFAVLLGLEGGHSIEHSLSLLRTYYRLGIRYMTLTWARSVGWADSCGDLGDPHDLKDLNAPQILRANGLSDFGHEVIREMNRLGMMIDVSHASDETFWAVVKASSAPAIASHSSARALTPAPRNLTDDQLGAIRDCGGIVMVNFFPAFIDERWHQAWNSLKPERETAQRKAAAPFRARSEPVPFAISNAIDREFAARIARAPFSSLIDHFEHIIHIAGAGHVGIGSDFDGIPATPEGIDSAADLPRIADALFARGISKETIAGVFGGNLLRVFRTVEQRAETSTNSPGTTD